MNPVQNPYLPPASETFGRSLIVNRAREGLLEGAGWGSAVGLARGVIVALRGATPWYVAIGGSLVAGLVICGLVCAIGRAISGRLAGAWLGFALGLLLGVLLGNAWGGYHWTTTTGADGTVTAVGTPVGQIVGSGIGFLLGAIVGALADRVLRGAASTGEHSHHSSSL